jgi:hypothetical protein
MTNQHTRKTTKESIEIEDTNTHSLVKYSPVETLGKQVCSLASDYVSVIQI